jgi:unsaturated rhamnogalacturonyl hydrolase
MSELIIKVADRITDVIDTDWAMDIEHFDWVPAIGLYGVYNAYKSTKNKKYLQYLISWAERHLSEAYEQKTVNSTAPMLTIIELFNETGNPSYLKACKDIGDYILYDAPKTVDGGLEHTVTEPVSGFSDQVWADTLFMVCIFMSKLSVVTGEKKYSDFAAEQLCIHHRLLTDGRGLYYHGYNGAQKNNMSCVRWGRANAWIVYSTTEILNLIQEFDGRNDIVKALHNQIMALQQVQRPDGGFGTILDDTDSYTEISATAGIIAGIKNAINYGLIDDKYKCIYDKGIEAVKNNITDDGTVEGVSTGTPVMPDAAAYKAIPCYPTLYGQGLAIVALTLEQD